MDLPIQRAVPQGSALSLLTPPRENVKERTTRQEASTMNTASTQHPVVRMAAHPLVKRNVLTRLIAALNREPRAESREPRAESREPRAESREPRAESREPRAESREPRAESREPRAESREPRAESREPRAESREPRAESREPRAESREPRAESREPRAESSVHGEARRLDLPRPHGRTSSEATPTFPPPARRRRPHVPVRVRAGRGAPCSG